MHMKELAMFTYNLRMSNSLHRAALAMNIFKAIFFYKEDFIENQQKRRLTKTIYRAIYKIYIQSTTNFKIQTLYIIKKVIMKGGQ